MKKFAAILAALMLLVPAACAEGDFRAAQAMGPFSEGYAAFQNEQGLWGYIDRAGSVVIDPAWALADPFIEGLARVGTADHHYGYIDMTGAVIFQPVSTAATDFHDGLATVQVDGAYGFILSEDFPS